MLHESGGSRAKLCRHGVPRRCAVHVQSSPHFECFGCGYPIILDSNLGVKPLALFGTNNASLSTRNTNVSESTSLSSVATTDPLASLSGPMISPTVNRHYHAQCFRCYQCDEQFFENSIGLPTDTAATTPEAKKKTKPQQLGNKYSKQKNSANSRKKNIHEVTPSSENEKLQCGGPRFHQIDSLRYQCRACFFQQGCRSCKKPVLVNVGADASLHDWHWPRSLAGEHGSGEEKYRAIQYDAKYLLYHSRHFNCDDCHASLSNMRFRIVPGSLILQCRSCLFGRHPEKVYAQLELSDDDIDELYSSDDEYDERASKKKKRNGRSNHSLCRYKCAMCRLRCVCTYLRDAVDNFQALRGQRLVTEFDRMLVSHYVELPPLESNVNLNLKPIVKTTNDELAKTFTQDTWKEAIDGNIDGFPVPKPALIEIDEPKERQRILDYHRSMRRAAMAKREKTERKKFFLSDCCAADSHKFSVSPLWILNECKNLTLSESEKSLNTEQQQDDDSSSDSYETHPKLALPCPRLCTRCGFCECCYAKRKKEIVPIQHSRPDSVQPSSLLLALLSCHSDMQRVIFEATVGRTFEIDILRFNSWRAFIMIEVNENWTIGYLQTRAKKQIDYKDELQLWLIRNDHNPNDWEKRVHDLVELKLSMTVAEVMEIILKENYIFAAKLPGWNTNVD